MATEESDDVVSTTFPKEICYIDAQINSLFGVHLDSGLISINLHCNNISVIENLDRLQHLKHLDLSSNHITRIQGLGGLKSLKTLNLSCNELQVVEGLGNLRNLMRLDLSYNAIHNLSGLKKLHGPAFNLRSLYLHGNQLTSLDHVITCLIGCRMLKDLTLSQYGEANPVCEIPTYRSSVLTALKTLEVLDGLDRTGKPVAIRDNVFIEMEDYMEYLKSESSTDSPLKDSKYEVMTPRIDSVLDRFRQRGPLLSSETDAGEERVTEEPPVHNAQLVIALNSRMSNLGSSPGRGHCIVFLGKTDPEHRLKPTSVEGLTLETSAFESLYGSQFTISTQLIKRNDLVILPTDVAPQCMLRSCYELLVISFCQCSLQKKPTARVSLSADHEVRLETLEHQLTRLIHNTERTQVSRQSTKTKEGVENSNSDESESNEQPDKRKQFQRSPKAKRTQRVRVSEKGPTKPRRKPAVHVTVESTSSTSLSDQQARNLAIKGKAVTGRPVRDPRDDETHLSLIQELDSERERRWKAEQAARRMVDAIKEMQLKETEENKLREASLAASSRLKRALLKEKETKDSLQKALNETQAQNIELSEEVKRLKETEEDQQRALRVLEQATTKMETDKIKQHAKAVSQLQQEQMRVGALTKECELSKHSVKQLKGQVQQLQELLANREQEHRKAVEGLVRADSQEVREIVDREVAKQESLHQQIIKDYQEKLNKRDVDYAALEDEFRMGLQIEANRFRELQEAFERVSDESAEQKEALHTIKQKENKATTMVNELTAMVKEQRGRISELSRGRQEIVGDYKERVQTLEKQLNEANKQLTRLEVLEQDKAKLTAQIRAQGSVIEGLRSERKLWSEELAQQGSSLAQDRGRMEARTEALTAEVSELKKECQSANETTAIKSKIIEDQTDSIRKLKQKLADQDSDMRQRKEDSKTRERNLEEQLAAESSANQELQEQMDAVIDRKESLKQELKNTQDELQTFKDSHRALKAKWQEKSELIGKLEKEVVEMRNNFKEKEKTLTEERDKAIQAANSAVERLKACDDAFRKQLEQERQAHEQQIQTLTNEKQREIEQANTRVLEVEDEMRVLLQENAITKRTLEKRLQKLTSAFTEIQHDLAGT